MSQSIIVYFVTPGLNYENQELDFLCCSNKVHFKVHANISLLRWESLCLAVDLRNKSYLLYLDEQITTGVITSRHSGNLKNETFFLRGNGFLIIGQDQDDFEGRLLDPSQSFKGNIADLQLYDSVMSLGLITEWALNKNKTVGFESRINFTNFDLNYENHNVSLSYESFDDLVKVSNSTHYHIFLEDHTFQQASALCQSMGGSLPMPESFEQNQDLFNFTSSTPELCNRTWISKDVFWIGAKYDSHSGWYNYMGKNTLSFKHFSRYDEPDGSKDCVSMFGCPHRSNLRWMNWMPYDCNKLAKVVCSFREIPVFKMRGLCNNSLFDKAYYLNRTRALPEFVGLFSSRIEQLDSSRDYQLGAWMLTRDDIDGPQAVLSLTPDFYYPAGLKNWSIKGDRCSSNYTELMLTHCREDQFPCSDGSCIRKQYRCDHEEHCEDGSDESECHCLVLPPVYYSNLPPPNATDDGYETGMKLLTKIYVSQVYSVELTNFVITSDVVVKLHWKDYRLQFRNLKNDTYLNVIRINKDPWIPQLHWLGHDFSTADHDMREKNLRIIRQGEPIPDNSCKVLVGK